MTITADPATLAQATNDAHAVLSATHAVAQTAYTWLTHRALTLADGQWTNRDVLDRMATVVANTRIDLAAPGHLTAATPDTTDGGIWHYVARNALTHAAPAGAVITQTAHNRWAAHWAPTA